MTTTHQVCLRPWTLERKPSIFSLDNCPVEVSTIFFGVFCKNRAILCNFGYWEVYSKTNSQTVSWQVFEEGQTVRPEVAINAM